MIVISGITSSLGISLAKLLATKGIRVLGFSRCIDKVKQLLSHPLIELQAANLNDEILMQSICSQAQGVVHLAALSAPWGKYSNFYQINVEGTKSIVRAALHSKLKHFVHVSTPSIYFNYKDRIGITEEEELPKQSVNAYATTKKMAEAVIEQAFVDGLPCITLRPRAIFGPHDQTLFPRVLKVCQKRGIPHFRKQSPIVDITYVDNVAHALWLSLNASSLCFGQKYNITNEEPLPLWEILQFLLAKLSIPTKINRIPYALAYNVALISELKSLLTGKEPFLTRYGIGVMHYSQTLSIEKAKRELNYHPIISLSEGIKRYVNWIQTQ
ncbi:MAG: NAD-dependent epimerase/dehydratase family protein [Candidatus Rhabdochlamydia sp.]